MNITSVLDNAVGTINNQEFVYTSLYEILDADYLLFTGAGLQLFV